MLHASSNERSRETHAAIDLIRAQAHQPGHTMDPEKNIDEVVETFDEGGDEVSVDDFIKQLEEKEKDLHITAETSIIEIAEAFDDGDMPEFLKEALDAKAARVTAAPAAKPDTAVVKKLESEVGTLKATLSKMEADR